MLSFQGVIITALIFIGEGQAFLLVLAATLIGFNYGTNLSLFPSATKDCWVGPKQDRFESRGVMGSWSDGFEFNIQD